MDLQESDKTCVKEYCLSALLAVFYVGSIYVWKQSTERSTHPTVVKKRFLSVSVATIICVLAVQYFLNPSLSKGQSRSFWALLGFRSDGLLNAVFFPIILTVVLFLGPLVIDTLNGEGFVYNLRNVSEFVTRSRDIVWIRNYIFAPISEEVVFRACMLVLIIDCTHPLLAMLSCPLFFGAAHVHHVLEQVRFGVKWKQAILVSSFQFLYTTIFGAYSAFLFLRTGHVIAPIAVHAFCNTMGFPDFGSVTNMSRGHQVLSVTTTVLGLICWVFLLHPLTHPELFSNTLPWSSRI